MQMHNLFGISSDGSNRVVHEIVYFLNFMQIRDDSIKQQIQTVGFSEFLRQATCVLCSEMTNKPFLSFTS